MPKSLLCAVLAVLLCGAAWAQQPTDAAKPADAPRCQTATAGVLEETSATDDDPQQTKRSDCIRYALGLRFKLSGAPGSGTTGKLRPIVGLQYGPWSVGVANIDNWLGYSGGTRETGVSYRAIDTPRLSTSLSARVLNIATGEGVEGLNKGRYTLRARATSSYRLTERWSLGADMTYDLLRRGDGMTLSLGLSHRLPLSARAMLSVGGGATWGNAEHWRTAYASDLSAPRLSAGLGAASLGASVRYKLSNQWALFGSAGVGKPIGAVSRLSSVRMSYGGQVGVIWFGAL
jgi:hypothetical protein